MQERGLTLGSRVVPGHRAALRDWGTSATSCSPCSECNAAEAKVTVFAYLTPCFNDCGPYGQCSLLRRHGYLYAGCSCKAGECLFPGSFVVLPKGRPCFSVVLFGQGSLGCAAAARSSQVSQRLSNEPSAPVVASSGAS